MIIALWTAAFAQDLPPELLKPAEAEGPAHVSVILSTGLVGGGIETPVQARRLEAVGLRGGFSPALNLSLDGGGDLAVGTFVAPYVRFGRQRVHLDGHLGPAVLLGQAAGLAFVSGAAVEVQLTSHLSLRAGGSSFVALSTAIPALYAQEGEVEVGLAPDLGVNLRW